MNESSPTRTKQLKDILLVATYPLAFILIILSILFYQFLVWPLGIFSLIFIKMITESNQIMENNILWDTGLIFHKNSIDGVILVLIIWWLILPVLFMPYMVFNYIVLAFALIIIGAISFMIIKHILFSRFLKPYQEALLLYDQCKFKESKAALKALVEKNPEDRIAWCALTTTLSRLKEYDEADKARDMALQGKIKTWPVIKKMQMSYFYYLMACSWENLREYEHAHECVDKALEYNDILPLTMKGYLLLKQGKIGEAGEYINKAFKLEVSPKDVQLNKACLLSKEGHNKRSHQIMDHIMTQKVEFPYVYLRKGELLREEGKLEEAEYYLNKFKMICPEDDELRELLDNYAVRLDSN